MRPTSRVETFPANTPAASQIFTTVLSQGPLTRLEVARRAGLSPAAITKAVKPLIEAGYLVEDAADETRPALGRPANPIRVDGGRTLFLGIKVTGDEIIAVLADLRCCIRAERRVRLTGRDPGAVLAAVAELSRGRRHPLDRDHRLLDLSRRRLRATTRGHRRRRRPR